MSFNDSSSNYLHIFLFRIPSQSTASVGMDQAKLDKKRERNRIAASKCRQRKMEKIQTLGKLLK